MTMRFSSRQFNQDSSGAKKAAQAGPVFITDRGRPAYVLMTIEDYHRLSGVQMSLVDAVAQDALLDFEFHPPRLETLVKPADLT